LLPSAKRTTTSASLSGGRDRIDRDLWTTKQALQFIEHHRDHRHFAAFYLLLVAGVRRGELLGLRWCDVTEDGIAIRQTVTVVVNKALVGPTKTKASSRFVALPADALAVLAEHKVRQETARAIVGDAWTHPELVFPSEVGTPMDPHNFYRDWKNAVKAAGLPHARIHDMRHLNITLSILRGDDPKLVSDRAGHSSTAFTLDRYAHVFREHRQRGARSLEDLLGSTSTPTTSEPATETNPSALGEEGGGIDADS
jgi:integrase